MAAPVEKGSVVVAIVFDFETGGLDFTSCAATQISMHAVRLDTFEVMDKYAAYIYPYRQQPDIRKPKKKVLKDKYASEDEHPLMLYSQEALDVSAITMDILYKMGKPLEDVCADICGFIERNTLPAAASCKPILVGHNPQFDGGFMQQIMCYSGMWGQFCKLVRGTNDFWGNFQPVLLDTIVLCQLMFGDDKSIETWKLEAMAERLGIDLDDAHDADADVTATREAVRVLTSRMRCGADGVLADGVLHTEKKEKLRDHFKI